MKLQISQLLLIFSLVIFLVYIVRFRSVLRDRIIFILASFIGIFFVLYPDLTTWIANRIGIGRGTDLLFYLFVMVFIFYSASVGASQKKLEARLTRVIRHIALNNPQEGPLDLPTEKTVEK